MAFRGHLGQRNVLTLRERRTSCGHTEGSFGLRAQSALATAVLQWAMQYFNGSSRCSGARLRGAAVQSLERIDRLPLV